jgi:hypothetical protein
MVSMGTFTKRLWVCALLAGCGGGGGSVTVDNLGTELASVSCSKMFECCTSAEIMEQFANITVDGQPITTEEQCESFAGGLFSGLLTPEYKASIAAGRITYDGEAAQSCLDAMANLGCNAYAMADSHESVVCDTPFIIPQVGDGGGCTEGYECTSGFCDGASDSTDGTCKPKPGAGEACDFTCADGLYCGFDQTNGMKVCQTLKTDGAECNLDYECASDHCDDTMNTCGAAPPTCDGR